MLTTRHSIASNPLAMITSLLRDLRYALRTLGRNPGFACVSVLALALGIGANSAIFTVVNSVLLQPLRFHKPEQLVVVRERNLKAGFPQFSLSPGNYLGYRDQNHTFSGIAAFGGAGFNLAGGGEPERLRGTRVTLDFFDVLGRSPALGRTFTAQETQVGQNRVVILSHGLWQRRFAGSRDALGQSMKLNDELYTVIGVMPPDFQFPARAEIWTPLAMNLQNWQQRGGHYLSGIGRLKAGTSLAAAQTDLNAIAARAEQQFPNSNSGWDTTISSLQEAAVGRIRPALLTLTAAVGFVLLIACVNLANLLLSRSSARRREMGVRSSLGAGRARLIRQLLTESLLLAAMGATAGLALAWAGTRMLVTLTPNILPRASEIALDGRALGFTAAIAILTGILFGLAPAIHMAKTDLMAALRDGGRGNAIGFRRNRLRSVLVVGEVALALVLLSGAGLLMRSFYHLQSMDPGFDPHDMLTFRTNLPAAKYKGDEAQAAFYSRALERIRSLPGVTAAGAAQIFPLAGDDYILSFVQLGKPPVPVGNQPSAAYYAATPGYFRALRIPITRGRDFTEHDNAAAPPVAIISESMARQFYANENPLGQRIQVGNGSKPAEIVGIAGRRARPGARGQRASGGVRAGGPGAVQRHVFWHPRGGRRLGADPRRPLGDARTRCRTAAGWRGDRGRAGGDIPFAAAIRHAADGHLRRPRAGAGDGRDLRRDFVFGDAGDAGDRDSHGAGRAARRRPQDGLRLRRRAAGRGPCDRRKRRARHGTLSRVAAL